MYTTILAIDTSTPYQAVALLSGDRVLAARGQSNRRGHSTSLVSTIDSVLAAAGKSLDDIQLISIGIGPGSFTGVRVGLAAAKSLAFVRQIPMVAVSSLKASAAAVLPYQGLIVPAFDARKREVYASVFRASGTSLERLSEDRTHKPTLLIERIHEVANDGEQVVLTGQALGVYQATFAELAPNLIFAPAHRWSPDVGALAVFGRAKAMNGELASVDTLEPNYQRASEAELTFARSK